MEKPALSRVLAPAPPSKPSSLKRLRGIAAAIPPETDLILLGDSLAAGWPRELYAAAFPNRRVFNFGLPGDRVQNTLWRLGKVPVGHLRPRELVLLLGTNNLGDGDPPEVIAAGIEAVVGHALALWGNPAVIVATVPRRGEPPGFREADRIRLKEDLLRALTRRVTILDADEALASRPGEPPSLLPDLLHLSPAGYARLSHAAAALIDGLPGQSAGLSVQATDAASPGLASLEKR